MLLKLPNTLGLQNNITLKKSVLKFHDKFYQQKEGFKSQIIVGDAINILERINKNNKFDIVIADPPYNIGKDFGNNKDCLFIDEYINWSKKWLNLCFDVLADNGLIYVYGFPEILTRIAVQYPIKQQRILVWHYTNKTTPSSTFWQRSYESILCLWKNKRPKLEIDQIREPYTNSYLKCIGKKRKNTKGRFGDKITNYNINEKGALPRKGILCVERVTITFIFQKI